VRLVRPATPIAVLVLAVSLAACGGGSKVTVQEPPGGTADLTISGGDQLAPTATATATPSATATTTAGATSTPAASTNSQTQTAQPTATAQSTPQGTAGGGAAAPSAQATPPPGSDKQKFEAFCQQNPGAC
jgi:hypothetical protein